MRAMFNLTMQGLKHQFNMASEQHYLIRLPYN